MKRRKGPFTREYAEGFAAGLEFANDSAISEVDIDFAGSEGYFVTMLDEDYTGESDEDPS